MLRRINWKAIAKGFAWAVCLSGVVVLLSFIGVKKQELKCTNVKILIPGVDNFIEREEIDAILKQSQGELVGRKLANINIHEIEKTIQANPYIAFAKVYADMDGVIQIQIKQRQPVLRIINAGGQNYYIDREGLKMPLSPNFTANVLVATGNILEGFGGRVDTLITPLLADLYKTALFMKQDSLWDAQFEQIYVNHKKDMELIPRVGKQRIILGNADSLITKMDNLLAFYKQAMPEVGWNAYKTINIKYVNQIVCEKNRIDSAAVKRPVLQSDSATVAKQLVASAVKNIIEEEIKKESEKVAAKETKAGSIVRDPSLYRSPNKSAPEKTKAGAATKEKTDTKKSNK
ncbi:cell division protein FtsQ/DivIB [Pedobacter insulae]|uniref:Cell division protein FtsQ n=1 Tax=Pedobacter insulae TaxID=414048 RepID=A0A1I2VXQ9_9SPHI|nr:cell division protein FtsQ [Pedobacter insulae]SFG92566.1 cell division protein FtsQ [Pedobacter insulae]